MNFSRSRLSIVLILFFCLSVMAEVWAAEPVVQTVPDTGQTQFYNNSTVIIAPVSGADFYGQDASYPGHRSYSKLDASGNLLPDSAAVWFQVLDNVTGLVWEVKTAVDGSKDYQNPNDGDNTYTWYDANPLINLGDPGVSGTDTDTADFISDLNRGAGYCGADDWRLPSASELARLTDLGTHLPAITTAYFPNTKSSNYWTSTTNRMSVSRSWCLNFYFGDVNSAAKAHAYYVRAVRSLKPLSLRKPFIVNENIAVIDEDDTVTDPNTGLMWQRFALRSMDWQSALSYCTSLSLGGHSDWRLPDRAELHSLVDLAFVSPAMDEVAFPSVAQAAYWSSTTTDDCNACAWNIHFGYGSVANDLKLETYMVRAVRYDNEYGILFVNHDNKCAGHKACYATIAAASAAENLQFEIRVASGNYYETLDLARDREFTLSGGWNVDYSSNHPGQTSSTVIHGSLVIAAGGVVVNNITLSGAGLVADNEVGSIRLFLSSRSIFVDQPQTF